MYHVKCFLGVSSGYTAFVIYLFISLFIHVVLFSYFFGGIAAFQSPPIAPSMRGDQEILYLLFMFQFFPSSVLYKIQ